ncbi:MAG TPA: hypothetical protein GX525_10875 [Bacilli bacterium]|nr:hypothetical protein [Bacilli bacterium]
MKVDLLIKNGSVVFPRQGVEEVNIGVTDGKIVGIFNVNEDVDADKVIDAKGLHVFPGLIESSSTLL